MYKIPEHVCKSHISRKLMLGHFWKHHVYAPAVYFLECTHVRTSDNILTSSSILLSFTWHEDTIGDTNSVVISVCCINLDRTWAIRRLKDEIESGAHSGRAGTCPRAEVADRLHHPFLAERYREGHHSPSLPPGCLKVSFWPLEARRYKTNGFPFTNVSFLCTL